MVSERAQLGENGRVVIPAAYRKAMGLKGGEVLLFSMDENGLHIQSQRQALLRSQAIVASFVDPDCSLVDELIADRRAEAVRERDE
jgi:AbrB family looped-hinge helix DNA binding protein